MISNDKNIDDPQKGHIINYGDLEILVDKAIKKYSCELFNNKTPKECKYMQKVAEDRHSELQIKINAIIFIVGIGVAFSIPFIHINNPKDFIGYTLGNHAMITAVESYYVLNKDYLREA